MGGVYGALIVFVWKRLVGELSTSSVFRFRRYFVVFTEFADIYSFYIFIVFGGGRSGFRVVRSSWVEG